MSAERIAVTGASGGLGVAVVRQLREQGKAVSALVRSEEAAQELTAQGVQATMGDVRQIASLRELCRDADVLIHLAAWMGSPGGRQIAEEVNVQGTENALRAASDAGVRRVVLASSIAVHGAIPDGEIDETTPLRPTGDAYGDTKLEGEQRARSCAAELEIELVVLRPTMIYGPRSGSWTLTPVQAIARGLPAVIGSGSDLLDAVYVEDAARAFVLAAATPEAAGETFVVAGHATDWNTFFGHYANMYDKPLRRIPAAPVKAAARAAATVTRAVTGRPRVIPEMIDVMTSRARFSRAKAERILSYQPNIDLEEGMRRTESWLRQTGQLRRPAVALVTGAASGLGAAVVRELLSAGLKVYATDVRSGPLAELEFEGAMAQEMDVTDPASIAAAQRRIASDGNVVDVVVNAAGLARPGAIEVQDLDLIRLQFDVNAYGPLYVARAFTPAMRERGWGRVVNVSSTNGFLVTPFMGAYSAAKYALEALSDALRLELGPFGVEVLVVEPGAMRTPFVQRAKDALRREIEQGDPAWAPYLERFLESDLWGEGTATEPEVVARRIARTALRGGRARSYGTLDAIPTRAMAMMPDAVKDAFFRNAAGLRRGRGGSTNEAADASESMTGDEADEQR